MTLFDRTVEKLIKEMPIVHPVSIEIVSSKQMKKDYGSACWGDSEDIKDGFNIRIAKGTTKEMTLIFIHEIAHVYCWGEEEENHGDKWGIAHAKAWRIFAGEV